MTLSRFLAALLATTWLAAQEAQRAFVEVDVGTSQPWLHEPVVLTVRIGWDAGWFATSALPLFQQRLDQPFHVTLPWLSGAEDRAVDVEAPASGAATQRIAVGDRVLPWTAVGRRAVGDRQFDVLELRCRWLPLAPGVSPVAAVELRYAFATRFQEDFLRGRLPLDREERTVASAPSQLLVRDLPREGRPAAFTGAVGEFAVAASAARDAVVVGESFLLEVAVRGTGNLERAAAMPWPVLPGFHVQGLVERRQAGERTFVFDVLALRENAPPPVVRFAAFSPRQGRYVVHEAGPVPVRVAAAPRGTELPPRVRDLVAADEKAMREAAGWPWWAYALAAAASGLAGAGLAWWRRRARAAAVSRRALAAVERAVAEGVPALLLAFEALCALRAGQHTFAAEVVWPQLAAGNVPAEVVAAARRVHGEIDAARFGGAPPPVEQVLAVARRLALAGA